MITQCCQCLRIREGTSWVAPKEPLPAGEPISHGYCPSCGAQFMGKVRFHRLNAGRAAASARADSNRYDDNK
jgi:hypothetical protein